MRVKGRMQGIARTPCAAPSLDFTATDDCCPSCEGDCDLTVFGSDLLRAAVVVLRAADRLLRVPEVCTLTTEAGAPRRPMPRFVARPQVEAAWCSRASETLAILMVT